MNRKTQYLKMLSSCLVEMYGIDYNKANEMVTQSPMGKLFDEDPEWVCHNSLSYWAALVFQNSDYWTIKE